MSLIIRCVLPSQNGAEITLQAARIAKIVFGGCLRNALAVAAAAQRCGSSFNVIAAGERWPDGSLRPALEDWLGAGAILRHLVGVYPSTQVQLKTDKRCQKSSLTTSLDPHVRPAF